MKKIILYYKGRDNWDRPVYESNGNLFVDVNPGKDSNPKICTKYNNDFYGEPDNPIAKDVEVEFVPCRDTWNF